MSSGEKLLAVGNIGDQLFEPGHRVLRGAQIRHLHEGEASTEEIEAVSPSFEILDHLFRRSAFVPLPDPVACIARWRHTIRDSQNESLDRDALRR